MQLVLILYIFIPTWRDSQTKDFGKMELKPRKKSITYRKTCKITSWFSKPKHLRARKFKIILSFKKCLKVWELTVKIGFGIGIA